MEKTGIYINLDINSARINSDDWKSVYLESLKLLKAYDFLDKIVDTKTYEEVDWIYGTKSKERKLPMEGTPIGWNVIGSLKTMESAENFILLKDLKQYKRETWINQLDQKEIYLRLIQDDELIKGLDDFVSSCTKVFQSKTQGLDYHNYVLAIALLIESRFPNDAVVHGDISKGQMKVALEWANSILEQPINMPQRTDDRKLLDRIKTVSNDEYKIWLIFEELTFSGHDQKFGEFIRSNFRQETIKKYWLRRLKKVTFKSPVYRDYVFEYLSMGYELDMLCDICVSEKKGCKIPPKAFIEDILSYSFHLSEGESIKEAKRALQYSYADPDSEASDTIGSLFGKIYLQMTGINTKVKPYISLEKMKRIFDEKLSSLVNVEQIFLELIAHPDNVSKEEESFLEELQRLIEKQEAKKECDIHRIEDLILWKPGDTISENITNGLKPLKEILDKSLIKNRDFLLKFNSYDTRLKMKVLTRLNKYFLIKKDIWDYLQENFQNEKIINRFLKILSIEAHEVGINDLCAAVVNNLKLFEFLFL